jgi:hypothetical protein
LDDNTFWPCVHVYAYVKAVIILVLVCYVYIQSVQMLILVCARYKVYIRRLVGCAGAMSTALEGFKIRVPGLGFGGNTSGLWRGGNVDSA